MMRQFWMVAEIRIKNKWYCTPIGLSTTTVQFIIYKWINKKQQHLNFSLMNTKIVFNCDGAFRIPYICSVQQSQ